MKQSIQLRIGQHLAMTPQLQQAIKLLQLSSLELQLEVRQVLDSNLMLESVDDEINNEKSDIENTEEHSQQETSPDQEVNYDENETTLPDELAVDSSWEDVYDAVSSQHSTPDSGNEHYDTQSNGEETLHDRLMWQLDLSPFSDTDHMIAESIIDAINPDGYMSVSLDDLYQGIHRKNDIEYDEVEAVLHRIQQFDPAGVGARNPAECMSIQLKQLPQDTPWRDKALILVEKHINLLASHDFKSLMKKMRMNEKDLNKTISLIQTMKPHPGSDIAPNDTQYVVPDVFITRNKGQWEVHLNAEAAPRLRINSQYAGMIRRADNSSDNNCLKNHLQEARWFLKSMQSRNETLIKVATCIVKHQKAFLDYGPEAMKPLILRDIAEDVEMHESTISRVTTQKYMHTPRGIFEFKYFFSSHVNTVEGGECSSTAIHEKIKKLISTENHQKPLSDNKLANMLSEDGINIARRTIAKYREAMNIPPSNERKHLL
ncbi:MAG: RNA polymerase factor sigma-54 [Gammaproteobacteria bacterium]|nr:RNA polymerase factor sigma-54 [Gammaproteobacteria bacterium]